VETFLYKATDTAGNVVAGDIEAEDTNEVVSRLHGMGYIPMQIRTHRETGLRRFNIDLGSIFGRFFRRVTTRDVVSFTQDMTTLLEARLPVDRALSILTAVAGQAKFHDIIKSVVRSVQGGSSFSEALRKYPRVFNSFYVSMVKAGEEAGVLDAVMKRLSTYMESIQELRDEIRSAMIYPLFLLFVGGASIVILLTFVIPKFSIIFEDMGQAAMPLSTQILLQLSEYVRRFWWVMIAGIVLAVYLFRSWVKTDKGRIRYDQFKLKCPVVGNFIRTREIARFARMLGTLMKSGVPILQALRLVRGTIESVTIANSMEVVYERVKEGEKLSVPLVDTAMFPPLAIQIITIGEETGRLDDMLLRIADNYEKSVRDMVKRFISVLEPAMILIMGVLVGFVVISMLMAVFSMNEMPF